MSAAALHPQEESRLSSLREYDILDSVDEIEYDDITKLAAFICGTPVSLITMIDQDRQWVKSNFGSDLKEMPREQAFCAHGLLNPSEPFIVPDTLQDSRFVENPLVTGDPNIKFYAGISLMSEENLPLGSLCVIHNEPHSLKEEQLEALKTLARQVERLLDLRRKNIQLEEARQNSVAVNQNLREFAHIIAHDLKAPIRNMRQLSEVIAEDYANKLDEDGREILTMLSDSGLRATTLIEGVLEYAKATRSHLVLDQFKVDELITEVITSLSLPAHLTVHYQPIETEIKCSRIALEQVIQNLLTNAVKYHDKETGNIWIDVQKQADGLLISVKDDGAGIKERDLTKIFEIFYVVDQAASQRAGGTGVGLSIVQKLVTQLGGKIKAESEVGVGSTFSFVLPTG